MASPGSTAHFGTIRCLITACVENERKELDLGQALQVVDALQSGSALDIRYALSLLAERLFRRKGLFVALELLDFVVRNVGLRAAVEIDEFLLMAMRRLLKLKSLNEQSVVGWVSRRIKGFVAGPPSPPEMTGSVAAAAAQGSIVLSPGAVSGDVLLVRCQKKILSMIRFWVDTFKAHRLELEPVFLTYEKLVRRGVQFPPPAKAPPAGALLPPGVAPPPAAPAAAAASDADVHRAAAAVERVKRARAAAAARGAARGAAGGAAPAAAAAADVEVVRASQAPLRARLQQALATARPGESQRSLVVNQLLDLLADVDKIVGGDEGWTPPTGGGGAAVAGGREAVAGGGEAVVSGSEAGAGGSEAVTGGGGPASGGAAPAPAPPVHEDLLDL